MEVEKRDMEVGDEQIMMKKIRKHGGWKAMPFILGNGTLEKLASIGLMANFMVYLLVIFHMSQASAANLLNIILGILNFSPLFGAFISDAYLGKFLTIAIASFASLIGMIILTLTAWLKFLHPPPCQPVGQECKGPNGLQMGMLLLALGFNCIGTAGIRPCSISFGIDQFDATTEQGRKGIASFYNWYFMSVTIVGLLTFTVVVYIQDSISWALGFGIPAILMTFSILLFFVGMRVYVNKPPQGSLFPRIFQVLVAAYRKRKLPPPHIIGDQEISADIYDPPLEKTISFKLPLTNQYKLLNKAAIIEKNELNLDGSPTNRWKLCTIQQVEEVKCIARTIPIWFPAMISLISISQQTTFTISQALKMDRHLGSKFKVPAGSIVAISMITLGIWIPLYDKIIIPWLRKRTKLEGGITSLQRIGIGIFIGNLTMVVSGIVEKIRRNVANSNPNPLGISNMSVFWLSPQLILTGFCEAFNVIGQIEFFNTEFPEHMKSIASSLYSCSFAGANYITSLLIVIVHRTSGAHGGPNWLTNDLNEGRLDYFYYLIAVIGSVNFMVYLFYAARYRYKTTVVVKGEY